MAGGALDRGIAGGGIAGYLLLQVDRIFYDLAPFCPDIALLANDASPAGGFDPYQYGATTAGGGNGVNESSLAVYLLVLSTSTLLCRSALGVRRETRVWGRG